MVPFTMLSVSHDAENGTKASHEQKSYVAHHFKHLDLRNVMVPLMVPSASCDANASDNHFDHLGQRKAMMLLTTLAALHGANDVAGSVKRPKKSFHTSF